jgi:hypothetical protein
MLIDLQSYGEGSESIGAYDLVIVGAGAAGITLANKLAGSGKKIALVEGGGIEYSAGSQALYTGRVIGDPYFDLRGARLRYFGGSTNHWTGWCRGFDEIDFKRGYFGEEYEWPITLSDVNGYMGEACKILEISIGFSDKLIPGSVMKQMQYKFSPPVRFKDKYFDELSSSANVTVFLNSTLTDISGTSGRISSASFKSLNGNEVRISGASFVFAMGGIENSRYLLWFKKKYANKFFSAGLPIGQYWMEHPHFTLGRAIVDKSKVSSRYYSLDGRAQQSARILNCGFRVHHVNEEGTNALIKDILCVAPTLGQRLVELAGRDLVCGVSFRAAWEQSPEATNAVVLDDDVDHFGVPRPVLHWRKSTLDRKTIKVSVREFNDWLLETDGGRIQLAEWMLNDGDYPEYDELAGYHHMGGTRMHHSPKLGVVNGDCKVYGSENLYMAGSSIFTTGGHNNPTLPIVQFALRLADHLKSA